MSSFLGIKYYPLEYFNHMVKVRLENVPKAVTDGVTSYDCGAPVYVPVHNRFGEIIAAEPVGILLSYEAWTPTPYMHYEPIADIIANNPHLRFIVTPPHPSAHSNPKSSNINN